MKKLNLIFLITLVILLLSGNTYAFPDIRGHWAERVIREVSTERPDVIGGFPDGTMRPSDIVTREQFIKMLTTGIRAAEFTTSRANFTDVGIRWSRNNIHSAVHLGILKPNEEGIRFRPAEPITREDMALYTTRLLGIGLIPTQNISLSFSDKDSISERHRTSVATAVEHRLLAGYPDGTFGPKRNLTRAEAFVVISRILSELKARENIIQGTEGRTFGNIGNFGVAAAYNGWIYFSKETGAIGFYRIRDDGTGETKLASDIAGSLFISGDWIYYSSWPQERGNLHKIRTDGTSRTRLVSQSATKINVEGDWVYFINRSSNARIYKVKTDGSGLTRLTDDRADALALSDGWLYYSDVAVGRGFYKIRTDGTERTRLVNLRARNLNIVGPWIIFGALEGGIWRIKTDGTGLTRINGQLAINTNVSNNKIYYVVSGDNFQLYSTNLNGTGMQKISTYEVENINLSIKLPQGETATSSL
ncbi:MAG: DUF5050 domain-containing protein [Dethiobacter sp.]|nr:DUF5050 domain-containing protein [Dethiobacter sp.]